MAVLRRIFVENLHWKLISLLCSFILWWFVRSIIYDQVEEPRDVAVILVNQPQNLIRTKDLINHFEIRLSGPRELISAVRDEDLRYVIDLTDAVPELNTYPIILSRIEGVPGGARITDVTPSQISIYFDARVVKDNVPVSIELIGKPAPGYEVKGMTASPAFVTIDGARYQVERTNSVPTEPVDITGANGPVEKIVGMNVVGTYLQVVDASEVIVTVDVVQKQGTRTFEAAPIRAMNTLLSWTIDPPAITVRVTGPVLDLEALPPANLNLHVDAEGLAAGEHTLPVRADPPAGMTVNQDDLGTAKVKLTVPAPSPASSPAPSPAPAPPPTN